MKEMNSKIRMIATGGIIAALYVALTFVSSALGLTSGAGFTNLRLAECLCIIPIFTPAAIPGLFVGCILSNILFGGGPIDVIFGSLATLAGAIGTYMLRKNRYLAVAPPILSNTIIMPFVFMSITTNEVSSSSYTIEASTVPQQSFLFYLGSTFVSEFIMVALLGSLLYKGLEKYEDAFR